MKIPKCLTLLMCRDATDKESVNGELTLIGLFIERTFPDVPTPKLPMLVYVETDGGLGTMQTKIRIVGSGGALIAESPTTTTFTDNGERFALFVVKPKFAMPGRYLVQFWADEHLLMQRPLTINRAGGKAEGGEN